MKLAPEKLVVVTVIDHTAHLSCEAASVAKALRPRRLKFARRRGFIARNVVVTPTRYGNWDCFETSMLESARFESFNGWIALRGYATVGPVETGVLVPAAVVPRVVKTLRRKGFNVSTRTYSSEAWQLRSSTLTTWPPAMQRLLHSLATSPRVNVYARTAKERWESTIALVLALRPHRVLVLVNNVNSSCSGIRQLHAACGDLWVPGRYGTARGSGVIVDSVSGSQFHHYPTPKAVIIQDPETLGFKTTIAAVRSFQNGCPLRIAYSSTPRLNDGPDGQEVEATFGPLLNFSPPAATVVQVIMTRHGTDDTVRFENHRRRAEDAFQNNERRNREIAALMAALVGGTIPLRALTDDLLPTSPLRAVAITDGIEHLDRLQRITMPVALRNQLDLIQMRVQSYQQARLRPLTEHVIVLADGCQRGWPAGLRIKPQVAAKALIIDVADDFDARSRSDAQSRRENYLRRGWDCLTLTIDQLKRRFNRLC